MVQKGWAVMKQTRKLKKHGTTIEARLVAPDLVQIRYIGKYHCDWIKETYDLSTLLKSGWEPAEKTDKRFKVPDDVDLRLNLCKRIASGDITAEKVEEILEGKTA